jgi:putative aldouronate transport system substrate-binding protein
MGRTKEEERMKHASLPLAALTVLALCAGSAFAAGQAESTASAAAPVELLWYQIGTPQQDTAKVMEYINKTTRDTLGVTIRMEQMDWGDYDKKMQVIVQSGEKFDICFTCSWALNYREYAQRGAFADITGYMDTDGAAVKKAIHPLYLKGALVNGRLYAIPNNKDLAAKMTCSTRGSWTRTASTSPPSPPSRTWRATGRWSRS